MGADKKNADRSDELCRRVEEILKNESQSLLKMPRKEIESLLKEMLARQNELERKNQNLQQLQYEIEKSRDQYLSLFDIAPVGYLTMDPEGRILEGNLTCATLLGTEKEALGQMKFPTFVEGGFHDSFFAHFEEVLEKGTRQSCELMLLQGEGAKFFAHLESMPVSLGKGKGCLIRTALIDITDRKRVEEALKLSEESYRSIFETAAAPMTSVNREGIIVDCNLHIHPKLGYTPGEIMGQHMSRIIHPDSLAMAEKTAETVLSDGKPVSGEYKLIRKDKEVIDVVIHSAALKDEQGKYVRTICVINDITEHKRAERALLESENRFRELVANMSSGVAVYEAREDGNLFILRNFNRAAEEIEKVKRENLIGKDVCEVFPGVKEFGLFEVFQRVWRTGKPERHPVSMYKDERIDGWRENYVYKLPSGEIVAVYDDVSERKKSEERLLHYQEQLQSLAAKSQMTEERLRRQFAADLHDCVSQNLAAIKMNLEMLREPVSSLGQAELLENAFGLVQETSESTRSLSFDLCPPVLYELGISPAVDWLVEEFQNRYGISVQLEDDETPKELDDEMLGPVFQVLRELLTNVAKHAEAERVSVKLERENNNLLLRVVDDGVGFDPAELGRQGDREGGFGLFGVKERLRTIGGYLDISSERGKGSRVSVVVPLEGKARVKWIEP